MFHRFKNGEQVSPTQEMGRCDAMNTLWWDDRVLPDGLMSWPRGAEVTIDDGDVFEVRISNGDVYRVERLTEEMIDSIVRLLGWLELTDKPDHTTLYPEVGVFYILVGILNNLDLAEHGTSIRWGWLTPDGKRLLCALREHSAEAIHEASGDAYDGCEYGD